MSLYIEQIKQLVDLQKVDDEIFAIRREMENAPKEVEELRVRFAEISVERGHLLEKLDHLREQGKRLSIDIDTASDKLEDSKSKLMQVGNAKEYHAMMREMDSLERNTRNNQEERNALLEEAERQHSALAEVEERFNAMKNDLEAKETTLESRVNEANARLEKLDSQRGGASKNVPAPVFARYEFIRQRLPYPVIVPVNSGICSGCHISIPPQSFIEIQKGAQILSCPNCQRLIYWGEHFSNPHIPQPQADSEE